MRRSAALVTAAAVAAALWLLSGLAFSAVAFSSSSWSSLVALVVPPTVPATAWQLPQPWNWLLPLCSAVLFGALLALALSLLAGWSQWRRASPGLRFLAAWLAAIGAAFVTAAVWAVGSTIASATPTGTAWAFRSAQPDLLASGYGGVVWGWLSALVVALLTRAAAPTAAAPPRRGPVALLAAAAVVALAAGAGVVAAQPAATRAARIAAGGAPNGLPIATPSPSTAPPVPPPRVAGSTPAAPVPGSCSPDDVVLSATGGEGALGHRALTLVLVNRSAGSCVVDGYPDVAFADADGHDLGVTVRPGASYLAADPGPRPVSLAPGAAAEAHLAWDATGARAGTAASAWVAPYAGASRTPLPVASDITGASAVTVTAWATTTVSG